jgi:ribosomal protein S18 acetylase RimI-like enzyme
MSATDPEVEDTAERVAALADIVWRECYRDILSKGQIEYMLKNMQSREAIVRDIEAGSVYMVLRDGGRDIGYTAVRPDGGSLYISKVYVMASMRGKGFGRQILDWDCEYAREHKIKRAYLHVNRNNVHSIEFYKRYGLKICAEQKSDIGHGYFMDDYVMDIAV